MPKLPAKQYSTCVKQKPLVLSIKFLNQNTIQQSNKKIPTTDLDMNEIFDLNWTGVVLLKLRYKRLNLIKITTHTHTHNFEFSTSNRFEKCL